MRDTLEIIFKRKWLILIVMLLCMLMVLVANYTLTSMYRSEARILIQVGREATLPPTAISQPLLVGIDRSEHINSHLQILESRHLVEQTLRSFNAADFTSSPKPTDSFFKRVRYAVKNFIVNILLAIRNGLTVIGLISPLTDEQRLILYLEKSLDVERVMGSYVIKVSFKSPSPELAQAFLERYMTFYLQAAAFSAAGPSTSVNMFMEEAAGLSKKLCAAEKELADFRMNWQIYDLETQKGKAVDELAGIDIHIRQNELELDAAKRLLTEHENRKSSEIEANLPDDLRNDEAIIELLKNIVNLKVRYSKMTSNYSASNEETEQLAREISSLADQLAVEVKGILESRVRKLESRKKDLLSQQAELSKRVQILDSRGIEMGEVERRVALLKKAFMQYSEKEEISRMNQLMGAKNIAEVALIQPPDRPIKPVSPRKMLNLALGMWVGLFLGFIYAFLREYAGGTVNQSEALSEMLDGKPVVNLPELPELPKDGLGVSPFTVGDVSGAALPGSQL